MGPTVEQWTRWGLAACLVAGTGGCLTVERDTKGSLVPYILANELREGESTLTETVNKLGSPDLALRVWRADLDRLYYTYYDISTLRFIVPLWIPGIGRVRWDLFVGGFADEHLWVARLEFDRSGKLTAKLLRHLHNRGSGYYGAIDNSVVTNLLEDEAQALSLSDPDHDYNLTDDDEEEEADDRARSPDT